MPKNHIITGLDIGTSSIKALSVLKREGADLEVLGQFCLPVSGMRKGVVADIDEVSKSIHQVISQLQNLIGQKIEDVYINIGGEELEKESQLIDGEVIEVISSEVKKKKGSNFRI